MKNELKILIFIFSKMPLLLNVSLVYMSIKEMAFLDDMLLFIQLEQFKNVSESSDWLKKKRPS